MIHKFALTLSVAASALIASTGEAGKYNSTVNIGDPAPAFSKIVGTDDKAHSLSDFEKAKAVVVVFTCNHCPVAAAYEDRLIAIQKEYKDRGVEVVAISVNNGEHDRLDKMKVRAKEKGFNFPYLHDSTQKSAHAYGAAVTPHVFLLDGSRKIAYMGSVDDSQSVNNVKKQYLRNAIDAVLAGKAPETTETRQFGCSVKYDN